MDDIVLYHSFSITWSLCSLLQKCRSRRKRERMQCFSGWIYVSHGLGVRGGVLSGLAPPTGFLVLHLIQVSIFITEFLALLHNVNLTRGERWLQVQRFWWFWCFLMSNALLPLDQSGCKLNGKRENKHGGWSTGEKFVLLLISSQYYVQYKAKHLQSTICIVLRLASVGYW